MAILVSLMAGVLGLLVGWVVSNQRSKERINQLEVDVGVFKQRADQASEAISRKDAELAPLHRQLGELTGENKALQDKLSAQLKEFEALHKRSTLEFESTANKILSETSKKFGDDQSKNLGQLLTPLREKITEFEKKLQDTQLVDVRDRTSLKEELKKLTELNQRMSVDATNLTKALKGESKVQGNWGEVVLESILERSGLRKGTEYITQETFTGDDGQKLRPDVTIHLPDNKHLIIDSKVSLKAYEQFVSSETDELRTRFLNDHVQSVQNHVSDLSSKHYASLKGVDSPDFVLLFMPIEAAYMAALQSKPEIFQEAWEKHIIVVTPTTLWGTLSTITQFWKIARQNDHAAEVLKRAGMMYDKFVSFTEDLKKASDLTQRAVEAQHEAYSKLTSGHGNLVGRIDALRKFGAKVTKSLDRQLLLESEAQESEGDAL